MQNLGRVSIFLFKSMACAPCKIIEKNLRDIISTSSMSNVNLTLIDTDEEPELTEKYNVRNVPCVLFNDKIVLTAQMAAELLNEELGGFTFNAIPGQDVDKGSSPFGTFDFPQEPSLTSKMTSDSTTDDPISALNFDKTSSGFTSSMFGNNAVFNHLFNSLIEASVEASEEELSRWQKFNMLTISQKTMSAEAIQQLTRASLGDYVHIGVLQSIVTSILAINPASSSFLYHVGMLMGRYSNTQFRFLTANPRILEPMDTQNKFRDILEGLQELYSANSLGLPLYLASRSLVVSAEKNKARLLVYDSAYSAQMAPINQPVCYLIAGEIAGLIETTLGEENVSVVESKCWGLGDNYCQFDIEIGKKKDFRHEKARLFLTDEERAKFQNSLNVISKNMYNSSLLRTVLRPNPGDYVHISVLQQALNGIKFSDPFFSSLLFYAGIHYGKNGADFAIMERIMKKAQLTSPLGFENSCKMLNNYLQDPSTVLTRLYGQSALTMVDEETAKIKIFESAISAGLNFETDGQFLFEVNREKAVLCDFTAGFFQGRLERISDEDIRVKEIACHSLGNGYCEFLITID